MSNLADKILASPEHRHLLCATGQSEGPGASPPAFIPIILADAVAEYYFAGTPREAWEFGRDFTDCTPPASTLFMEMARPTRIVSGVHGIQAASQLPDRWGWRFEAMSAIGLAEILADDRRAGGLLAHYRQYVDSLADSGLVDMAAVDGALADPDPRGAASQLGGAEGGYFAVASICRALDNLKAGGGRDGVGGLLHGSLVLESDGHVAGPVATVDVLLDVAGRPFPAPLIDAHGGYLTEPGTAMLRTTILPLTLPAFLSLSFMNSEGVILRPAEPSPGRARRDAGQCMPEPVPYLVMDIDAVAGVGRN